jgi:hypothetical protein
MFKRLIIGIIIGIVIAVFVFNYFSSDDEIMDNGEGAVCGNNICEEGEADIEGGCGPDADPECLGPPSFVGSCVEDC